MTIRTPPSAAEAAQRRSEIVGLKSELERATANIRFEKDLRSERTRDVKDADRRSAEAEVQIGE